MITKLTIADKQLIKWAVGNLHCCMDDRKMLETVRSKFMLDPAIISPAAMRAFDKVALRAHRDNRRLFGYVMGGM